MLRKVGNELGVSANQGQILPKSWVENTIFGTATRLHHRRMATGAKTLRGEQKVNVADYNAISLKKIFRLNFAKTI